MTAGSPPAIETVGVNRARLWGLTAEQRLERIAAAQGLSAGGDDARILVNLAFVFEPAWLRQVADRPGQIVTRGGVPVLAHCVEEPAIAEVRQAMIEERLPKLAPSLALVEQETSAPLHNAQLRKREVPFIERLTDESAAGVERADYYASYKGVTDLLTRYLWPEWALVLTRLCAGLGVSPNAVTLVGAAFCVAAGFAFFHGWYWSGMAAALVFMVFDTVDGKLARCTITSSKLGDVLDHGIDLIHPPLWWWAWGVGLHAYGRPLDRDLFLITMGAIIAGYLAQRAIEGLFILWFKMHIHVWQPLDSRFRLIAARRNPNMVILFVALVLGYPDIGLVAVGTWTVLSCAFHLVRLVQARLTHGRGPIPSWLEA
jgi:phosphatidylglycerophosphate synthase